MLKKRTVTLEGRDSSFVLNLTELPALVADTHARKILKGIGEAPDGGIVALAFQHARAALKMDAGMLLPFVDGVVEGTQGARPLDIKNDIKDWRHVSRLQHFALSLHVDFLIGRDTLDIPVTLQAQNILAGSATVCATFCSSQIAAVLSERLATYRELETILSTEDVFNLCEILNVTAIRDWQANQGT